MGTFELEGEIGMIKHLFFLLIMILPHLAHAATEIQWISLGPGGGGWIQSLACDPFSPGTVYLGGDIAGLYYSENIGGAWKARNVGLHDYFVESILVIPTGNGSEKVLLLGTEGGVFKWSEEVRAWVPKRSGFPPIEKYSFSRPIASLAYDPSNPSIVYAGIGRPRWDKDGKGQIYKSNDYGESWSLLTIPGMIPNDAIISDIEVASDGKVILAATSRGLYRSENNGQTWVISTSGLPHTYCEEVTISPSQPNLSYLTLRTTSRGEEKFNGGVYRSDDYGQTWNMRNSGLPDEQSSEGSSFRDNSSYKEIVVNPEDPNTVYVGADSWSGGLYKTIDGGNNWKLVTLRGLFSNMDYGWLTEWGATITSLAISPVDPQLLYIGTPGHVFVSQNSGLTWQQQYYKSFDNGLIQGSGLETTVATRAIFDPFNKDEVFLCYLDIGLFAADTTNNLLKRPISGIANPGDVFTIVADPYVKNKLWVGIGKQTNGKGNLYKSTTGGEDWQLVGFEKSGLPDGGVIKIVLDKTSDAQKRTLYAGSLGNGIYKSIDDGDSWVPINTGLPTNTPSTIVDIEINDKNNNELLSLWSGTPEDGTGGLYRTNNGGLNWEKVLSPKTTWSDVKDLAISPSDWKTIYICQRETFVASTQSFIPGGLFKSTDGGLSWEFIFANHFANTIAIDPNNPEILFLGTNDHPFHDQNTPIGLLKSEDGGISWRNISANLSNNKITSITIDPSNSSRVLVGTGGNGYFLGNIESLDYSLPSRPAQFKEIY